MSLQDARLRANASGRVQGVGYRWFVQARGAAMGLTGGVRNMQDGSVEVIAEGPRGDLEQLIKALWEGPSGAEVRNIEARWEKAGGTYKSFKIWGSR